MYFHLISVLILSNFASICFSQTAVAPTAPAHTVQAALQRFTNDPKLANITHQVALIHNELHLIEKVFEMQIVFRNITQLNEVLKQVKVARQQASLALEEIHSEIANAPIRSFLNRIHQETIRIEVESYNRALKWIGLEVLGDLSDVSKFENYYYSETVSVVRQLLITRFSDELLAAYEADLLIEEANKKDPLHGAVDKETKAKIDKFFQSLLTSATGVKSEFAKDYYEELEKVRLDNRELNLIQRLEFEALIDLLNFMIDFVTKYEQLFLRIA